MDSLPIETSRLIPTLRAWENVRTALASAPLCSTTPTGPEVSRTADPMPCSAISASTPSTAEAGTMTNARSTGNGRSATRR